MKGRIRPFEYMSWALATHGTARFDLTASGVPDLFSDPTAEAVRNAAFPEHLSVEEACRRRGPAGAEGLCSAIASRYGVDPTAVVATVGSSLGILHALLAFLRGGDHVIVERPAYEALHRVPTLLGAEVSRLERRHDEDWDIVLDRLAKLITPRTRAVLLTNLHNPSARLIPTAVLRKVGELAARVGALVCVDEVYLDFVWPGDESAAPACNTLDNGVSWSSTTKAMGLGSLRAGWIVARDPEVARAIRDAGHYLHVELPRASVVLAELAVRNADAILAHTRALADRGRGMIAGWLRDEPRVNWVEPAGGLCGCVRLPDLVQDVGFSQMLRERFDTQVVPGSMFEAPGTVRIGHAGDPQVLAEGLANFSRALDEFA